MRWQECFACRDYAEHRRAVLVGPLTDKALREGRDVVEVVDGFMLAAHDRHMAGTPLRDGGPTRVTNPDLGRMAALMFSAVGGDQ